MAKHKGANLKCPYSVQAYTKIISMPNIDGIPKKLYFPHGTIVVDLKCDLKTFNVLFDYI